MTEVTLPSASILRERLQKVVLITGAASGIGRATAELFAQHGAKVILVDLDNTKLKGVAEEIGHGCDFCTCDVSSWDQQVAVFDWVTGSYGPPDIVCLNAGIDPELMAWSSPSGKEKVASNFFADEYGRDGQLKPPPKSIMDVNFTGVLYGIKLASYHFPEAKGGRIIITGSSASYIPVPYQDIYVASKHALIGLMRSTSRRQELKEKNISIAMVGPWLTRTPLTADMPEEIMQAHPTSRPEDVARGIAYLATAEQQNMNGKCVWTKGDRCIEIEDAYEKWLEEMMQK